MSIVKRKRGYTKIAFILVVAMVIMMIPAMTFAASDAVKSEGGLGFHCCDGKVNKDVVVYDSGNLTIKNGNTNTPHKYADGATYALSGNTGADVWLVPGTGPEAGQWVIQSGEGTFMCTGCGNTEWVSYSNENKVFDGKNVQLYPLYGDTKLKKTDSITEEPVNGAEFKLELFNKYTGEWQSEAVKKTSNGNIDFSKMIIAKYRIKETGVASGYIPDTLVYKNKELSENGWLYFKITKENRSKLFEATNDHYGEVELTKIDSFDEETLIDGASFYLVDNNDEDNNRIYLESLGDGVYGYYELLWGTYTLFEDTSAPGYVAGSLTINGEPIGEEGYEINIPEDGIFFDLVGYNDRIPGEVVLTKLDMDNESPIDGASFYLVNENGEQIDLIAQGDGKYGVDGLAWGEYSLFEGSAASGYDKDTFTIDGQVIGENGYKIVIGPDDEELGIFLAYDLTGFNGKVAGEEDFPGGGGDGGNVLGEEGTPDPFQQQVLGEEAKTGDAMNIMLIMFFLLAAVTVVSGTKAQRESK